MFLPPGYHIDASVSGGEESPKEGGETPYVFPAGLGTALMNGCWGTGYKETDPCYSAKWKSNVCQVIKQNTSQKRSIIKGGWTRNAFGNIDAFFSLVEITVIPLQNVICNYCFLVFKLMLVVSEDKLQDCQLSIPAKTDLFRTF